MIPDLKDIKAKDLVCLGDTRSPGSTTFARVVRVGRKYDNDTDKPYNVVILSQNRQFDTRTGSAITSPYSYFLIGAPDFKETKKNVSNAIAIFSKQLEPNKEKASKKKTTAISRNVLRLT